MTERNMARIVQIDNIIPHTNADSLEIAKISGWQVVVKKGEFKKGDHAVYAEIDSWIPETLCPWLTPSGHFAKTFENVPGNLLRTRQFRGELSQGLLLPLSIHPELLGEDCPSVDTDVSDMLGIMKWEQPLPSNMQDGTRGNFPRIGIKTEEIRIQNCFRTVMEKIQNEDVRWEIEEKIDGSSMSVINFDGEQHICSRNMELDSESESNIFSIMARKTNILSLLKKYDRPIQISGELIGGKIQGNPYKLSPGDYRWVIYDIYDLERKVRLTPDERYHVLEKIQDPEYPDFFKYAQLVPVIDGDFDMTDHTVQSLLELAEGSSVLNIDVMREGVVIKCKNQPFTFKVISNSYLLKKKC
jgi:RNA ligase (TIGR02306 family)